MKIRGSKFTFVMLFAIMAAALFGGCGIHYAISFGNGGHFLSKKDAQEFTLKKTAIDPITSIEIRTGTAKVELIEADEFYVEINYLYWKNKPEYSLTDGKLVFDDSHAFPDSYSINFNPDNRIKIYLPGNTKLSELNISNSSGDVIAEGFDAEDMDITVSYGDLTIKNSSAAIADITLSSGNSKISDFQAGKLDFSNSYGNATFNKINTKATELPLDISQSSIDIAMSSGDIRMKGLKTGSVDISNSYGDVTCEDITAEKFYADLSSGNLDVLNADLKDASMNDSYGDVTLGLIGSISDYSLDLDTSYGDITVDNKDYDEHLTMNDDGTQTVSADLSSGDIRVNFNK